MAQKSHAGAKVVGLIAVMAGTLAIARYLNKTKKGKALKTAMYDAKEHVFAHAKKLGKLSKSSYENVVDTVMDEYANMKAMSKSEIAALSKELKTGWKETEAKMKKKKAA